MSHKIGEWRDGEKLDVIRPDDKWSYTKGVRVTVRLFSEPPEEVEEILFLTKEGHGFCENLFDAFDAGFYKGKRAGKEAALQQMRDALGLKREPKP